MTKTGNLVLVWTLGDRLRKIRRGLGMSSREFAESLGVTNSTLAQWETDRSLPRSAVSVAEKIFETYGVPTEWVLFGCCDQSLYGVSPQESLALARKFAQDSQNAQVDYMPREPHHN